MNRIFESYKGEIPEIDPTKLDLIISLLTTFEANDLHTRNAINYYYDKSRDYIFLEVISIHNGQKVVDSFFGYDREKITNVCNHLLSYFKDKESKNE